MSVAVSEPVIVALIGVLGIALTAFVTFISSKHQRDLNLTDKVSKQVELVLNERAKQLDDCDKDMKLLKSEVHQLRDIVTSLIATIRGVLNARMNCPTLIAGKCPIEHEDLHNAIDTALDKLTP